MFLLISHGDVVLAEKGGDSARRLLYRNDGHRKGPAKEKEWTTE